MRKLILIAALCVLVVGCKKNVIESPKDDDVILWVSGDGCCVGNGDNSFATASELHIIIQGEQNAPGDIPDSLIPMAESWIHCCPVLK